jgi:peptidoglycan hydrolase-like protein with peptidoglycan-binding domain
MERVMGYRCTTTLSFGAATCLVLGVGLAHLPAPAQAQANPVASEATAQPPGSSDLDANFWALVRDSKDPEALQSYLYSFPTGKFAEQARHRLAMLREREGNAARPTPAPSREAPRNIELTRATPPPPTPAGPSATGNGELVRALQRELKRVGCLVGEADGVWGEQSRAALRSFVRSAKLGIAGDEPSAAALDAASAKQARVCPLVCDDGEKVVGDRCVAVAKPRPARREAAPERRREPRRAAAERPAPEPRESSSSGGGKKLCFGAARNELVPCQ